MLVAPSALVQMELQPNKPAIITDKAFDSSVRFNTFGCSDVKKLTCVPKFWKTTKIRRENTATQ